MAGDHAAYRVPGRLHDFTYAELGAPLVDPGAGFSKFQVWLGLRVFY
ncbi:MAG: hypothetical protein IPI43_29405 [Sandaracinaceae bacterium]|nr:hypothetical protein [Sandaracinaceae bacterium]